jgi:amyloid beta precursor protein binding protein 1
LESLLAGDPLFTIILFTLPIRPDQLAHIEAYGQRHKTPTVAIHSAGFYSYFQLNLPGAFPIVDTHPDETATTDLRLLSPWPELVDFAQELTKDIDNLDNYEHGHLPYVVILLHYLERWKANHGGKPPSTYKEKSEFRKLVQAAARTDNPEGGEENFDEAAAAVLKTLATPSLPSGLKEVFEHEDTYPVGWLPASISASTSPLILTCPIRSSKGPGSGSSPMQSSSSMTSTGACRCLENSPT